MLLRVYAAVRLLGGRGGSRRVADLIGVSVRSAQRYLKMLVDGGFVEPVRVGRRIVYRAVRPLTEEEAKRLVAGGVAMDAPVYMLARTIDDLIREGAFQADLVGVAKIHLLVPTHSRVTHDIDIVVAKENAPMLVTSLRYSLGLVLERRSEGVVYRLRRPAEDIKIDVMVDGFQGGRCAGLEPRTYAQDG